MVQPPTHLDIAQIVSAHGVKGELKVRPDSDDPLRMKGMPSVECLMPDGSRRQLELESVTLRKDGVLLVKFVGFDSPEAAGTLRQGRLQIPFEQAKRKPGKVLYADVLGLKAVHDEDGRELGTITEVLRAGQDLLEIRTPDGQEVLVPWVDAFVKKIDLKAGEVRLTPVEGLFE
ncbi:MAG: rRNA processing protein RimM [Cyanobacteria bacterium RYN_339]|nr:rRNA processing protein RimM [Cyanobacteria bacterium RYN_339]